MTADISASNEEPRTLAWFRGALLVYFALGLLLSIGDFVLPAPNGFARSLAVGSQPNVVTVTDARWLRADRGAVHNGDTFHIDPRVYNALRNVPVYLDGPLEAIEADGTIVHLTDDRPSRYRWLAEGALRILVEALALVLVVLRGSRLSVAVLSLALFNVQFFFVVAPDAFLGTAWFSFYHAVRILDYSFTPWLLVVGAAVLAGRSRLNRWTIWAMGIAAGVTATFKAIGYFTDPTLFASGRKVEAALTAFALVFFFVCAARAHASERRRLLILGTSLVLGQSIAFYGLASGPHVYSPAENLAANVATIIMTIGLTYAILVERLFDIGFVINRAAVYAGTSAFLILAFIAIEFFVGKIATGIGGTGSLIVEFGLAAAVGLSLRPIHLRVDDFIDQVFFGARHHATRELLAFADECEEYRSHAALFDAAIKTLRLYARPLSCALYVADGRGNLQYAAGDDSANAMLGVDHPAVVRMRTSRRTLERAAFPLLEEAEFAVPMLRQRELAGAILITLPAGSEPYSPEERSALFTLAQKLGTAADATQLTSELAELRLRLAAFQHVGPQKTED